MSYETGTPKLRGPQTVLHPLVVRVTHWLNAVAIIIMIGSGWQIYNQEPLFSFTSRYGRRWAVNPIFRNTGIMKRV